MGSMEGHGSSAKMMGSGADPCYGDWLLDSVESLRSYMKYGTEPSVQGKEWGLIYSVAPSHHGPKFFPTYHNCLALRVVHA